MSRKQLFDASLQYCGETEAALKVSEGEDMFWLPKSQIEYEKESDGTAVVDKNGCVEVTLPMWLAQEKKLVGA